MLETARRYSPVRHLAYSIWLNHDPDTRHMAMFTAYFDASGHPNAKGQAMFVSGFVAPVSRWLKFEREWLDLLKAHKIKNPFHMTEFIACSEQFASWKHDEPRQLAFYRRALHLIARRTNRAFSQGLLLDEYWELVKQYEIPDDSAAALPLRTPLSFCTLGAVTQLHKWGNRRKRRGERIHGPIEFVFDRGDKHRGEMADAVREIFGFEPIFKDKADVVPIQAADILAWEHARVCGVLIHGDMKKLRVSSWPEVARIFPGSNEWAYLNVAKMREQFDEWGLKRRDGQ